ncbi:MAG: hypothetical protein HKO59_13205, partial [Phycisphaerales bacterium]|nr:hypothetical protein [Phycisphaerae bacterium]NNM26920.1 hypothetical protein [Phycisphaerales bacterium]
TTGSLLGLAATTTFFLLKTLDVRWLRLNSRRGSLIAVLLIAAIAHHEVLPAANEPLALVVSVTAVSAGVLISGRWRHLAGAFLAMTPPLLATPTGVIEPERFSGRTHRGGFARAPRAPPH